MEGTGVGRVSCMSPRTTHYVCPCTGLDFLLDLSPSDLRGEVLSSFPRGVSTTCRGDGGGWLVVVITTVVTL